MASNPGDRNVLPQLNQWLEMARAKGARGVELLHQETLTHSLSNTSWQKRNSGPTTQFHLVGRLYLEGGHTAAFRLSNPKTGQVEAAVKKALTAAKRAPKDPFAGPAQRLGITERGHGIEDRRYSMLDQETREGVLQLNSSPATQQDGIELLALEYSDVRTCRTYTSTTENEGSSIDTQYSVHIHVRDTTTGHELDEVSTARHFSHVGSLPFGAELAKRLIALRNRAAPPPESVPLVLESRAAAWILKNLAPAFGADRIANGTSFVSQREERLGGPRVHVIDDPGLHGGLMTRPFDDRGVPPSPVAILREGLKSGFYQSPETARKADIRPTGHVRDGGLRPTNLILRAGNRSRTQMLSEVPVAISFDQLHGELDVTNGRLRCEGPAFVLEKGRPQGSLERVELDVDIVDLLMQVQEIAANQERHGSVDCATVLIREAPLRW